MLDFEDERKTGLVVGGDGIASGGVVWDGVVSRESGEAGFLAVNAARRYIFGSQV